MTSRAFQTPPTLFSSQPVVFPRADDRIPPTDRYVRRDDKKTKVQAWEVNGENISHLVWLTGGLQVEEIHPATGARTVGLNFRSLGDMKRASEGDWLVKVGENSFRSVPSPEFQKTYKADH